MKRFTFFLITVLLTVPAAIVNGLMLHRWSATDQNYVDAMASIESIPESFGQWSLLEQRPDLPASIREELGVKSHVYRVYANQEDSHQVTLLALAGESGPLVRHPVEVCYGNRAKRRISSEMITFETSETVDSKNSPRLMQNHAMIHRFESHSELEGEFFVAYMFGSNGIWDVPKHPRVAYGGKPFLFKVQVLTTAPDQGADGPAPEYLGSSSSILLK